ncbi:MAG: hypothetical protein NTX50_21395 [Candidatus Sumerlaeota bacterium]|nr:hypothetical protein [Candidatus Sumerlaeota bacterium]
MQDSILTPILMNLVMLIPMFLVFLAGIILALVRWNRHPLVSILTCIGFAIICLMLIAVTSLNNWLPRYMARSGEAAPNLGAMFNIIHIIGSILGACGWGFILAAIFMGRSRRLPEK